MRIAQALGLLLFTLPLTARAAPPPVVDAFKELLIVDPLVVEDSRAMPGGPWHFGTLLRQMLPAEASDKEVSDFVVNWLLEWERTTQVNGFAVKPRPRVRDALVCPWVNASSGGTDCTGTLNMDLAPFRLLAIVNRMDVRKPNLPHAGEGRFVFALLDKPTSNPIDTAHVTLSMTILVDYVLPFTEPQGVDFWARQWHALGSIPCTTNEDCEPYRTALASLTTSFTSRGVSPGKPNGSALSDIRTNEIEFDFPWQLREFRYVPNGAGVALISSTVNKTADITLNNSPKLIDFVKNNEAAVMAGTHVLPTALLGGFANQSFGTEFKWKLEGLSEALRFNYSKNTCNGCHREERDKIVPIDSFFHISPSRPAGKERVSPFVLNEDLPRREADFKTLLEEWSLVASGGR